MPITEMRRTFSRPPIFPKAPQAPLSSLSPTLMSLLKAEQKRLEAEVNSLSQQLATAEASLSLVNAQIAKSTNTTSYLYSLPNEIITLIFESGFQTSNIFPNLVSHISHRLREIALHSPTLWQRIFLSIGDDDENVTTYLDRSKGCPLDITVFADKPDLDHPSHHTHLSNILSHINRWRSLKILGTSADKVLQELATVSAPSLEELRVGAPEIALDWTESDTLFGGDSPKLSNVELNLGITGLSRLLSMKTITSLAVSESMFLVYDDLFQFLHSAPLLSELSLGMDDCTGEDGPQVNTSVSLPSLLTFEIFDMGDSGTDWDEHLCSLSKALLAPSLRHLKLGTIHSSFLVSFSERLNDDANVNCLQYPELGTLEISTETLDTDTLGNLVYGLPNVTKVTLCSENDNDGTVLILLCDETAWPHLDVLTVDHFDEANDGYMAILCHIIASRSSISRLCLRTTNWDERDPQNNANNHGDLTYGIEWLRNHVHVEYRNICADCEEDWNHSDSTWKHECKGVSH